MNDIDQNIYNWIKDPIYTYVLVNCKALSTEK